MKIKILDAKIKYKLCSCVNASLYSCIRWQVRCLLQLWVLWFESFNGIITWWWKLNQKWIMKSVYKHLFGHPCACVKQNQKETKKVISSDCSFLERYFWEWRFLKISYTVSIYRFVVRSQNRKCLQGKQEKKRTTCTLNTFGYYYIKIMVCLSSAHSLGVSLGLYLWTLNNYVFIY